MWKYEKEFHQALTLVDPGVREKSPAVQKLLKWFSGRVPKWFGTPRTYMSERGMVIRADCTSPGCSVRAVIHLKRSLWGWKEVEEEPIFDRLQNPCKKCKEMLVKK